MTELYDPRVHDDDWAGDQAFIPVPDAHRVRRKVMDEFTGTRIRVEASIGPEGRAWVETFVAEDVARDGRFHVLREAFERAVQELERRYPE